MRGHAADGVHLLDRGVLELLMRAGGDRACAEGAGDVAADLVNRERILLA